MAYALPVLSLPDNFPVLPADFHFFLHNDPGHIPAVLTVSHASTEYIPALLSAAVPSEAANSSPRTSRMHMHGSIPRFDNELRFPERPDQLPVLILWIPAHRLIQCFWTARIFFSHIRLKNHLFRIDFFLFHISLLILQFFPPVIHTKTPCFHPWSLTADSGHTFPGTHLFPYLSTYNHIIRLLIF